MKDGQVPFFEMLRVLREQREAEAFVVQGAVAVEEYSADEVLAAAPAPVMAEPAFVFGSAPWLEQTPTPGAFESPMQGHDPQSAPRVAVVVGGDVVEEVAVPDEHWSPFYVETWQKEREATIEQMRARAVEQNRATTEAMHAAAVDTCENRKKDVDARVEEDCPMPTLLGGMTDDVIATWSANKAALRKRKIEQYEAERNACLEALEAKHAAAATEIGLNTACALRDVRQIVAALAKKRTQRTQAKMSAASAEARRVRVRRRLQDTKAWLAARVAARPWLRAVVGWLAAEEYDPVSRLQRWWVAGRWARLYAFYGPTIRWTAILLVGLVLGVTLYSYMSAPVAAEFPVMGHFYDKHNRAGFNVVTKRAFGPPDLARARWLRDELRGLGLGRPGPERDGVCGYALAQLTPTQRVNVSLDMLEGVMRAHAAGTAECLCCGHLGVALPCLFLREDDALLYAPQVGERWPHPGGRTVTIKDAVFAGEEAVLPRMNQMSVVFVGTDGKVHRTYARKEDAACVDWCMRLTQ
ncbi:MAG TPA: hypothetical protein VKD22_05435 [Ramlibacter sp.]|nr:hypothetical protein [Ramlibacter sp.]